MHPLHRRIEAEYGEPFWDVVRGYASQGCSRRETARLLGYSGAAAFLRLLLRHPEIAIPWPEGKEANAFRDMYELARTPGSELHVKLSAACRLATAADPRVIWLTLDGVKSSLSEHIRRLGSPVSVSSVARRLRRGWPARAAIVTPDVRYRNTGQKGHQNHPWKQEATQC